MDPCVSIYLHFSCLIFLAGSIQSCDYYTGAVKTNRKQDVQYVFNIKYYSHLSLLTIGYTAITSLGIPLETDLYNQPGAQSACQQA